MSECQATARRLRRARRLRPADALIDFAATHSCVPAKYELRYPDIDLCANRIHCHRRVFRGQIDVPKTGKKTIALVPPARAIMLRQPTRIRDDGLMFVSKTGRRLAAPTMSGYWAQVKARTGLDFDFYLATKHYGVHRLYKLGLSRRAIAAQAGWSDRDVDRMLQVYGHADLVALAEVDSIYADLSDAPVTQDAPSACSCRGLNPPAACANAGAPVLSGSSAVTPRVDGSPGG